MCLHIGTCSFFMAALPGSLHSSPTPLIGTTENISQERANLVKATIFPKRISNEEGVGAFNKHRNAIQNNRKFPDTGNFRRSPSFCPEGVSRRRAGQGWREHHQILDSDFQFRK